VVFADQRGRGEVLPVTIVIGLAVLALLLARQVTTRPLSGGYRLPLILVIVGLFEFAAFLLGGGQQLAQFLKGHRSVVTIHDGSTVVVALAGSLVIAALSAAVRARTVRLWWQDGQYWRKGTAVTLVLWIASLAAHLLYDDLISRSSQLRGLGSATILLYFAVSLVIQRMFLGMRASRLDRLRPTC
jgi:predicted Co/Zn/Cd cation transporter (cation efflux family)